MGHFIGQYADNVVFIVVGLGLFGVLTWAAVAAIIAAVAFVSNRDNRN